MNKLDHTSAEHIAAAGAVLMALPHEVHVLELTEDTVIPQQNGLEVVFQKGDFAIRDTRDDRVYGVRRAVFFTQYALLVKHEVAVDDGESKAQADADLKAQEKAEGQHEEPPEDGKGDDLHGHDA